MTSSKLLFLAAAAFLGGCGVDHVDIGSSSTTPTKTLSDVPPSHDRDLAQGADVALPGAGDEVRVYVAGGTDPNDVQHDEVFSAAIHTDGTLGAWRAEARLPAKTDGVALTRAGSSIFAVQDGGFLAGIDDAAGLSHWRKVSAAASLANAGLATDGTSLVVLGGDHDGRFAAGGLVADLAEGMPGAFTATPAFPSARSHVGAVRFGRTVMAIGGTTESGDALDEVLTSHVSHSGSLDDWRPAPSLPRALRGHAVAAAGDAVFVLGGRSMQNGAERSVLVSRISDDGSLAAWNDAGTLPVGLEGHCVVASGANLFVIGGGTADLRATDEVLATTVNMDGTIGAWRKLTTLPFPLTRTGCTVR